MTDSLNGICNGFLICNSTVYERNIISESVFDYISQNFKLDHSHELQVDLSALFVPKNMKLWVLIFKTAEILQCLMDIDR